MLVYIFLIMIIMHIIADYMLQTDLMAKYKQVKNWKEYIDKNKKYKYDFIVILLIHSFEWAFFIILPTVIYDIIQNGYGDKLLVYVLFMLVINTCIHMYIDNEKANRLSINLLTDQLLHLLQIIFTFVAYVLF